MSKRPSLRSASNGTAWLLLASLLACTREDRGPNAPAADLVIRGGVLLDMVAEAPDPRPLKALVIRNGRIDAIIFADSAEEAPAATNVIDADSGYVLPGFIDAHVHFRPFVEDARIWKRASSHYGITTLFDTGPCGDLCERTGQDANEWIQAYKALMNDAAAVDGPTLYITGRRIQDLDGEHPLGERLSTREEIVDYMDFLVLEGCWSGSGVPMRAGCEMMDIDGDADVDYDDYLLFVAIFPDSPTMEPR